MQRRPRGYEGIDHQTIGSDLLAVLAALPTPDLTLHESTLTRLKAVEPHLFYPVAWFLDLMEELDVSIGRVALVRLGRKVFDVSHRERVLRTARSARDNVSGIDAMYQHAHRGERIGGWKVLSFEPGRARLEKTTPHHCAMEEGILIQGLFALGVPSRIEQEQCLRKGAPSCVYAISSVVTDARWMGEK
jgi:hypothetical protein